MRDDVSLDDTVQSSECDAAHFIAQRYLPARIGANIVSKDHAVISACPNPKPAVGGDDIRFLGHRATEYVVAARKVHTVPGVSKRVAAGDVGADEVTQNHVPGGVD